MGPDVAFFVHVSTGQSPLGADPGQGSGLLKDVPLVGEGGTLRHPPPSS